MRFSSRYSPKVLNMEALLAWSLPNIFLIFLLVLGCKSFFMPQEAGLDLRLPRAMAQIPADRASLTVLIDAEGDLYWHGQNVSFDVLQNELGRSAGPASHVFVKADRRASLDVLSKVWDACRSAGVGQVIIATNG